ncbi:MAG TPA: molybdopterin dinucleotide binding domain-containing protein [Thermoanaerobaculia bacterium]|nr:molybdopterin dinucleotide binding domain-containing protein [Thermoanaerobaculia bacterium]
MKNYPGPSRAGLASFPPRERWDDWTELDSRAWPERVERHYMLVPTTCFNCESACGLLAYVDRETLQVRKFEGNPEHPGSRGRNCAKGPATLNQAQDPNRILYPLKRSGNRGENRWERVSWNEALDDIGARIRKALVEGRPNEVMYHVGRPGEDGYTERVLAAWGVDGHNSHTNICSSSARSGYQFWMGFDRPSPDHANADVILLISAHLESGHYFNPHAQRVMEGKQRGAKLIVFDVRLSNTATHADHWLAPWPGSEAAILLAIASYIIQKRRYNREFVRRWWNWEEFMGPSSGPSGHLLPREKAHEKASGEGPSFEDFENKLRDLYAPYTFEFAEKESGVSAKTIEEVAELVSKAGTRFSSHTWRSATAGNLGGWQVARCLFLLNALLGAVATEGGVYPNGWNKFVPRPIYMPPHPPKWNDLCWPDEFPLSCNEMSFLLPHLLEDGRGKLDVYFSRVYNPVWTNPDGFSWIATLTDEKKIGLHAALTPTWSETAYFADYVLPVGIGSERHDLHSYETHDSQWLGFRQPVLRAAKERLGHQVSDTRETNPGEVWEENEFWIELSWRIDPDGKLGLRKFFESKKKPGAKLSIDEYYAFIFENSVPGLPERAKAEGMTPLEYMRRTGSFEIKAGIGAIHEQEVPQSELVDLHVDDHSRVFTRAPKGDALNVVATPSPDPDKDGRRMAGVMIDGVVRRGFPTPSGKLEFFSPTLASWGWPEMAVPGYARSHVHPQNLKPGEMPLIPTFRLPVQVHTRSANSKWLDEIAHTNPLWIHPRDAKPIGVKTGDLVRVETRIGHFIVKAWVTEGIRPGVVACSHHMGRWKTGDDGQRQMMATVKLDHTGSAWKLQRERGVAPYESGDADTDRIWWTDSGVHQNLTFPVQPDPISGMHCWHQAVRVRKAEAGDRYGDIVVDAARSRNAYKEWMERTRPASRFSPDGTRRPYWMMRPLKPSRETYKLPESGRPGRTR